MVVSVDREKVDTKIAIRVPFIECKGTLSDWTSETESDEDKTFRAFLEAIKDNKIEELKNLVEMTSTFWDDDYQMFRDQLNKHYFSKTPEIEVIGKVPGENGIGYVLHKPGTQKQGFVILIVGQTPQGMRAKPMDDSHRFPLLQDALGMRTLEELKASLKTESAPKLSDTTFQVSITPADQQPELKKEIDQMIARSKENQFADAFTPFSQTQFNKAVELPDDQKKALIDSTSKEALAITHIATMGPLVVTFGKPLNTMIIYYRDPTHGKLLRTHYFQSYEVSHFFKRLFKNIK